MRVGNYLFVVFFFRILILEEQLRENELRSEEKLAEEVKRHRELVARVDREKQLQVENCAIRLAYCTCFLILK